MLVDIVKNKELSKGVGSVCNITKYSSSARLRSKTDWTQLGKP